MTNAASRKDIRSAEKALVRAAMVNREVVCGLMSIANGREWVWNQLEIAGVFRSAFSPEPAIHAYNAGLRQQGVMLFNDVMLYAPALFKTMMDEAHARRAGTEQRSSGENIDRGTEGRDAPVDDGTDGDYDPYRAEDGNQTFNLDRRA